MATQKKAQADLQKFSDEHLLYEINMLHEMADKLINTPNLDTMVKNAYIESFLIHARNLLDFLYNHGKKSDDAIASDYADSDVWNPPPKDATLTTWYPKRMNKHLAHLTFQRLAVAEANREWDVSGIQQSIEIILKAFYIWVPIHNIGPALRQVVQPYKTRQGTSHGTLSPPLTGSGTAPTNPGTSNW